MEAAPAPGLCHAGSARPAAMRSGSPPAADADSSGVGLYWRPWNLMIDESCAT